MGEASFSTRTFIKWKHEPFFNEPTSTWVLTASNEEFVDTRLIIDKNSSSKSWFIAGHEEEVETKEGYLFSIAFVHDIDNFCQPGDEPGKDVGHFTNLEKSTPGFKESLKTEDYESLDFDHHRLEEGAMDNPDCDNAVEEYQEIWSTVDPLNSDAGSLLPLTKKGEKIHSKIYKFYGQDGQECGRYVIVGKFGAGMCLGPKQEYVAIRTFENKCIFESHENAKDIFNYESKDTQWKLTYED